MSTAIHWKQILVPTDFSEDSLKALEEARRFQELGGAEVTLLHVTEPAFDGLRIHSGGGRDEAAAKVRHQLEALATAYFGSVAAVRLLVKEGAAAEVICTEARALGAEVVIIATHGISALRHFLLGSVAESVVRQAPCQVLVVR